MVSPQTDSTHKPQLCLKGQRPNNPLDLSHRVKSTVLGGSGLFLAILAIQRAARPVAQGPKTLYGSVFRGPKLNTMFVCAISRFVPQGSYIEDYTKPASGASGQCLLEIRGLAVLGYPIQRVTRVRGWPHFAGPSLQQRDSQE